jgi:anti-anti-sigma regulatory factor
VPEIVLPRSFDISAVRGVATELLDALAAEPLTLDAGAVHKIDAAGVQLLCATVAAARAHGTPVVWKAVPGALTEAADTLALGAALGLPDPARQEDR